MPLRGLTFDDFVEHAFAHEVRFHGNPWFFDLQHDLWDPTPGEAVAHATRLFEDPAAALEWFSDAQIAQGLTYLFSTSASGDNGWFSSTEVPLPYRLSLIESIGELFQKLFLPRCEPYLGHLSEGEARSLNGVCYMWWDEFPSIALPKDPNRAALYAAALRTMERTLQMDSIACQESALHGLGHCATANAAEVARIIERYLEDERRLDPRLAVYARSARGGCVL